jgi:valyl-tRNA synthetase
MRTVDSVRKSLAAYRFNEAAGAIYQFLWHEYCDWYLEWSKLTLYRGDDPAAKARVQSTLLEVLETTLRLLHPFMPFITEEIWQRLPKGRGAPASIMIARFPRVRRRDLDPAAEAAMAPIMGVVSALRNLRSELQIPPSRTLTAIVRPPAGTVATSLQETAASVAALARAEIQVDPEATRPPHSLLAIAEGCDVYVPVEGVVDIEAERGRLSRELRRVEEDLGRIEAKLAREDFRQRAPAEVVAREEARRSEQRALQE